MLAVVPGVALVRSVKMKSDNARDRSYAVDSSLSPVFTTFFHFYFLRDLRANRCKIKSFCLDRRSLPPSAFLDLTVDLFFYLNIYRS